MFVGTASTRLVPAGAARPRNLSQTSTPKVSARAGLITASTGRLYQTWMEKLSRALATFPQYTALQSAGLQKHCGTGWPGL